MRAKGPTQTTKMRSSAPHCGHAPMVRHGGKGGSESGVGLIPPRGKRLGPSGSMGAPFELHGVSTHANLAPNRSTHCCAEFCCHMQSFSWVPRSSRESWNGGS